MVLQSPFHSCWFSIFCMNTFSLNFYSFASTFFLGSHLKNVCVRCTHNKHVGCRERALHLEIKFFITSTNTQPSFSFFCSTLPAAVAPSENRTLLKNAFKCIQMFMFCELSKRSFAWLHTQKSKQIRYIPLGNYLK